MRVLGAVFFGLILYFNCLGQADLSADNRSGQLEIRISSFVKSLNSAKKSDLKVLKKLFFKAHQEYLKNYVPYAQTDDIFEKGNYDCLSGTYFFASALDQLNISYRIVETNYHIFLIANTGKGEVLIETTDQINGFIRNTKAMEERISGYQQPENSTGSSLYLSRIRIYHELLANQLPGLLFFNRAVEAFNKKDLPGTCKFLEKAWQIYDNPRIEIFAPILLQSLNASALEKSEKEKLVSLIREHQQSYQHTIASR